MIAYRFLFIGRAGEVAAFEEVEMPNDKEAVDTAQTCLRSRSHHASIEVWRGGRMIYPAEKEAA